MPDTKHCLPAIARISRMACMVSSAEVELSKNTAISVASSVLKALYSFFGSISMGTDRSAKLVYQMTDSTCSTPSSFVFSASTSCSGMPSTTMNENAPLPKSFISSFCPITVSISPGR